MEISSPCVLLLFAMPNKKKKGGRQLLTISTPSLGRACTNYVTPKRPLFDTLHLIALSVYTFCLESNANVNPLPRWKRYVICVRPLCVCMTFIHVPTNGWARRMNRGRKCCILTVVKLTVLRSAWWQKIIIRRRKRKKVKDLRVWMKETYLPSAESKCGHLSPVVEGNVDGANRHFDV